MPNLTREQWVEAMNIIAPYVEPNMAQILEGAIRHELHLVGIQAVSDGYEYKPALEVLALLAEKIQKQVQANGGIHIDPSWTEHRITAIEHRLSGSNNPTWYCTLEGSDKTLYIRQSNKQVFLSEYPQLEDMQLGDVTHDVNITVYTSVDGDFLNLEAVLPGGTLTLPKPDIPEHQRQAITKARDLLTKPSTVILDFETTGLDDAAEIISFGVLDVTSGQRLTYGKIKPKNLDAVDPVKQKHGISAESLANMPDFKTHYEQNIHPMLNDKIWLIWNAKFDTRMLRQELLKDRSIEGIAFARQESHCLMEIASAYRGEKLGWGDNPDQYKNISLKDAAQMLNIETEGYKLHNALDDCKLARDVLFAIAQKPLPEDGESSPL